MINKVILVGNVGQDPLVKEVKDTKVASFSLATVEKYKDTEKTEWHNVTIWGGLAGVVEKYVKKGQLLYLEGKIQTDEYEKDGEKRYSTKIIAREMKMLGGGKATTKQESNNNTNDLPWD